MVPKTNTHSSTSKIGYFHCHDILKYYIHFSRAYYNIHIFLLFVIQICIMSEFTSKIFISSHDIYYVYVVYWPRQFRVKHVNNQKNLIEPTGRIYI
jgi:hypothetical protein